MWKVESGQGRDLILRKTDGATIAIMGSNASHADAHLISAAPELLEEAQKQLDWLQHVMPQVQASESVIMGFSQSIKAFEQVIAKAKGGAA